MDRKLSVIMAIWLGCFNVAISEGGQPLANTGGAQSQDNADASRAPLIFEEPLFNNVPKRITRVVIAQRSMPDGTLPSARLLLLAPPRAAVTTQAQPSLFWYVSRAVSDPIKITITNKTNPGELFEITLNANQVREGIQRLDLSRLDVTLHPGQEYEWAAMILVDLNAPARNPSAKSSIWRHLAPPDVAGEISIAPRRRDRARIAAKRGVWVDALALINDLAEERPNDPAVLQDLKDLLSGAGFAFDVNSGEIRLNRVEAALQ